MRASVAMAMPASPNSLIAMTVAIAEARILTKLLPMRIRPMSRSGRCSSFIARRAPRWPVPLRCFRRYRLSDIMLVSELEKKAEIRIRIASAVKSKPSEVSFKSP